MSFTQFVRVRLMPFNPLNWDTETHGALPAYGSGLDLIGEVNNGGGYAIGTTAITVDGFDSGPGSNVAVRFENGTRAYHGNFSSSTSLTIDPGLEEAVVDNEDVYVLPIIDITSYCMDVSALSHERELGTDDFIFDKQVRFRLANFEDEFYDSDTHTTAFSFSNAYFMTYNPQDARDYAYVTIELLRGASWQMKYAGKIVRDDLVVDVLNKEIEFRTESLLYETQDMLFGEVPGVYDGHWYTSSTRLTKTISGKVTDIIGKVAASFGIQKKGYTVTNKEKSGVLCILTIADTTNFRVGDLIDVSISDRNFDIKGGVVVSKTSTLVRYNHRITKTVASTGISVANGIYNRRVNFDKMVDFFSITHQGWAYTMDDIWWITPKWKQKDVASMTAWDALKNFMVAFAASAHLDYYLGVPRLYFRAKVPGTTSVATLTKADFVGDFSIQPNHRNYKPDGVEITADVDYWNGETKEHGINYNENILGFIQTSAANKGESANVGYSKYGGGAFPDSASGDPDHYNIKFMGQSQKYRGVAISGSLIDINPPAVEATKYWGDYIYQYTDESIELKHPECFRMKLKFPDIYLSADGAGTYSSDGVVKLINTGGSQLITDYVARIIGDNRQGIHGITYVPLVPISQVGSSPYEIPLGGNVFVADAASDYDIRYFGECAKADYSSATVSQNQNGDGPLHTDDNSPYNTDFRQITADVVEYADEDTDEVNYWLTIYIATKGTTTSPSNAATWLRRLKVSMADAGDYWTDPVTFEGSSRYWKLTASEKERFTTGSTGALSAYTKEVWGVFLNSDVLNPEYDEKVYFTDDDTAYSPSAARHIKSANAYGTISVAGALSGTSTSLDPRQIMISHQAGLTGQVLYFCDVTSDEVKYATTSGGWASLQTWCGGGVSLPAALGSGVSGTTNILLNNPEGCWVGYDEVTVISDSGSGKVLIFEPRENVVYTIADSTLVANIRQVQAVDFVNVFSPYTYDLGSGNLLAIYHDITYSASERHYNYHGEQRRVIKCSARYEDIGTDLTVGDLLVLDDVVSTADYNFQVSAYNLNLEEDVYELELTEVSAT